MCSLNINASNNHKHPFWYREEVRTVESKASRGMFWAGERRREAQIEGTPDIGGSRAGFMEELVNYMLCDSELSGFEITQLEFFHLH